MPKGQDFERQLCKRLSLWFSGGEDDNLFWRTSNSGGRATTRAKAGKRADKHCGDICSIDPAGDPLMRVLSLELKRGYNRATIHDLLDKPAKAKQQTYEEWFQKAERDRQRSGALYWALIHKRDRREEMIFLPGQLMAALHEAGSFAAKGGWFCFRLADGYVDGLPLARFFEWVSPKHIMTILQDAHGKEQTA